MPEINNQIQKDNLEAPQPEKLLDLPERRSKIKTVLIPFLILLILIGGTVVFFKYYKPAPTPTVNNSSTSVSTDTSTVPEGSDFYLTESSDSKQVGLYKYLLNSSEPDQKISSITVKDSADFYNVIGKWSKPYTYVVNHADQKFLILDATEGKLSDLINIPVNKSTREVSLSSDNQWLAYAVNDLGDGEKNYGEIWLYNTNTKETKPLVKPVKLDLYEGFSILGWRDNDKEIIASAIGCDGGGCGGSIYEINADTGEFVIVQNPDSKYESSFLMGLLSPDHDKWLYDFCAKPDEKVRSSSADGYERACFSGAELHTFDFANRQTKVVYQNLRYDNNNDKSMLRTFMSYVWQDNNTIIAAVPGALLSIGISQGAASKNNAMELLTYDGSQPQKFRDDSINLIKAKPTEIIYSREDKNFVFDRISSKVVNVLAPGTGNVIYDWLD